MLKEFLAPAERVDLATSNSTKQITEHLVIEVRHVDSRGVKRTLKLHFGILDGLRLYAITMNVMEVMQDLLIINIKRHSLTILQCYMVKSPEFS